MFPNGWEYKDLNHFTHSDKFKEMCHLVGKVTNNYKLDISGELQQMYVMLWMKSSRL